MKVLYITDALAVWGGIERVLSDKMNYLVDYGYDVYVVTSDQGDHPIPFPLNERVHVHDLGIRFHQQYRYRGIKRIVKYFKFERLYRKRLKLYIDDICPDIISCIRDSIVGNVLRVSGNTPVIFESHSLCNDLFFEKTTFLHRLLSYIGRLHFRKLDMIVTLTKGDADDWKRFCSRTCVIPNVVHLNDTDLFSECRSKEVIFVGRFDIQKNIGGLLDVWQIVQQSHPDWLLHVYGNGELQPFYEKEVVERKLNVIIHHAVSNIFDFYLKSSILVMTSIYEPFGLVLVEAMSCGLPVIAFDSPYGPADIISDKIDGFLVDNNDVVSFASRIKYLIDNKELRIEMGRKGIQSSKRYTYDKIMPQWIHLFNRLVKTK